MTQSALCAYLRGALASFPAKVSFPDFSYVAMAEQQSSDIEQGCPSDSDSESQDEDCEPAIVISDVTVIQPTLFLGIELVCRQFLDIRTVPKDHIMSRIEEVALTSPKTL